MICRLCTKDVDVEYAAKLFEANQSETLYVYVIRKYISLELFFGDHISTLICNYCASQLMDFHNFCCYVQEQQNHLNAVKPHKESAVLAEATLHQAPDEGIVKCKKKITQERPSFVTKDNLNGKKIEHEVESRALVDYEIVSVEPDLPDLMGDSSSGDSISGINEGISKTQEPTFINTYQDATLNQVSECGKNNIKSIESPWRVTRDNIKSEIEDDSSAFNDYEANDVDPLITDDMDDLPFLDSLPDINEPLSNGYVQRNVTKKVVNEYNQVGFRDIKQFTNAVLFNCDICGFSAELCRDFKRHMHRSHQQIPYINCCNKIINSDRGMRRHIAKHRKRYEYKCITCNKVDSLPNLLMHESHAKVLLECLQCTKSFDSSKNLIDHMQEKHLTDMSCLECERIFRSKADLHEHLIAVHRIKKTLKKCLDCDKCFVTQSSYQLHRLMHQETSEICPICLYVALSKKALESHHKKMHVQMQVFRCSRCLKCYQDQSSLEQHIIEHKDYKGYFCYFCKNSYTERSTLYQHYNSKHPNEYKTLKDL